LDIPRISLGKVVKKLKEGGLEKVEPADMKELLQNTSREPEGPTAEFFRDS
jgi:hypothetical protein